MKDAESNKETKFKGNEFDCYTTKLEARYSFEIVIAIHGYKLHPKVTHINLYCLQDSSRHGSCIVDSCMVCNAISIYAM